MCWPIEVPYGRLWWSLHFVCPRQFYTRRRNNPIRWLGSSGHQKTRRFSSRSGRESTQRWLMMVAFDLGSREMYCLDLWVESWCQFLLQNMPFPSSQTCISVRCLPLELWQVYTLYVLWDHIQQQHIPCCHGYSLWKWGQCRQLKWRRWQWWWVKGARQEDERGF